MHQDEAKSIIDLARQKINDLHEHLALGAWGVLPAEEEQRIKQEISQITSILGGLFRGNGQAPKKASDYALFVYGEKSAIPAVQDSEFMVSVDDEEGMTLVTVPVFKKLVPKMVNHTRAKTILRDAIIEAEKS